MRDPVVIRCSIGNGVEVVTVHGDLRMFVPRLRCQSPGGFEPYIANQGRAALELKTYAQQLAGPEGWCFAFDGVLSYRQLEAWNH